MRALARVTAEAADDGTTRITRLRSEAPLALRLTPDAVYLLGSAGGPLGGDQLSLSVDVGDGARLEMRTVAASVVLPGPAQSCFEIEVSVGEGASLAWLPEPLVAAGGCTHVVSARITLAPTAVLVWRDEVILGRHHEVGGHVVARLSVDHGGVPLLRQELDLDPTSYGCRGPAVIGSARAVGSLLMVTPDWSDEALRPGASILGPTAAVLPLAGPGAVISALAADALGLRELLDVGLAQLPGSSKLCSSSEEAMIAEVATFTSASASSTEAPAATRAAT